MKKSLSVWMAMLIAFGTGASLAGCGSQNSVPYDPDNFIEDVTNPQIVKEPVTITFYVPKHSLHVDYEDMRVFKEVSAITNINMKFEQADWEAYAEIRSLRWEDDSSLPDAFMFCNNLDEQVQYSSLGQLAPIDDLIDQYCPNYKALMEKYPEIEQVSRLTDGNIYSFTTVNTVPNTCYQYINAKWLEDLGLSMPTTVEEFRDVLAAFKEGDPNHNGVADEIPLCSKFNYSSLFILSAFGHVTKSVEITDDSDFIFVPQTEEYRAYLRYAKDLYDSKLMNQNLYEITDGDVSNFGQQNMVGCSEGVAAYLLAGDELADQFVSIPPLTSDYSPVVNGEKQRVHVGFSKFDPTALIITANTPYKREIARLIDFFYSEEGVRLFLTGKEGVDWEWTDEEHTSWKSTYPEDIDSETYRGSITPNVGLGASFYKSEEWMYKQENELAQTLREDCSVYVPYLKEALPGLVFTTEESEELTFIKLAADSYVQSAEADFITGRKSIEDDWTAFQNKLKQLQVDKMLEIYREAYARSTAKS